MTTNMLRVGCMPSHDSGRSVHCSDAEGTISLLDSATDRHDVELLRIWSEFQALNAELDRLTCDEADPPEPGLFELNQRWHDTCLQAIPLAARTAAGRRAKAEMLMCALDVVLGPSDDRQLHELLAESLARDLMD